MTVDNIFQGVITALITPFKGQQPDFQAFIKLLNHQVKNNVNGIVIGGSTGEGSSLTTAEYKILLQEAVNIIRKRTAIIGACNASSTSAAVEIAKVIENIGVEGIMLTLPPYIKPTQEGIYRHFKMVHDAVNLPIMIYAIQSRTGVNIEDETIFRLAEMPRIMALKDSCANLERPLRISSNMREDFHILSGDDELSLAFNAQGAKGCVSVVSNIFPNLCKEIQNKWSENKPQEALKIHQKLLPLYKALFTETNPIGIKYAAHFMGFCENELRLPLLPASKLTQDKIKVAIEALYNE